MGLTVPDHGFYVTTVRGRTDPRNFEDLRQSELRPPGPTVVSVSDVSPVKVSSF